MKNTSLILSVISLVAVVVFGVLTLTGKKTANVEAAEGETVVAEAGKGAIVYIDLDRILMDYDMANDLRSVVETKAQNIQAEVNRVQGEAAKLQEKYQKGLITTADFQQQGQALETRMQKAQTNYENLQANYQKDAAAMQEELNVLNHRIANYISQAVEELNADGRYKMIIDATMLVHASPELDMTPAVLAKVNELYAAEK